MVRTSLKPNTMEQEYMYKVYYGREFIKLVTARSRWEAVELVYSRLTYEYPQLIRSMFKAKKV